MCVALDLILSKTVVSGKPFKDLASLLLRGLASCLTASFRQAVEMTGYS